MSSSDLPVESPRSPARDSAPRQQCPLCDLVASTELAVYRHMLISHRKSELSEALLASVRNEFDERTQ